MKSAHRISTLGFGLCLSLFTANAGATPPRPSGTHPRIWLTTAAMAAMQANRATPGSSAANVGETCTKLIGKEDEFVDAGMQGYNWAYSLGTCALSWQLSRNAAHGTAAVRIYRALLDDYATMGDQAGGDDVVTHDTGYAMRFFGGYAALAYDWLYDAPGVDQTFRSHARARFKAWVDWYTQSGYLNHTAGSNYHAGYVFAKTLISVAEGGEDGATSDAYWADVTDNLFPNDLVANGLGPAGVLRGGDWPEGWQYGPMSVMEYALAARALEEQGVSFPQVRAWADDLTRRFLYGMNPAQDGLYTAGDLDDNVRIDAPLTPRTLFATLAGPGSDGVAAWAKHLRTNVATDSDQCPVFEALAEAREVSPVDFHTTQPPTTYLATGTKNLYVRGSWAPDSPFAVFTSAPRMVPDHQHSDASNFVFYRGADHLVVDPSPYGSRSTLTANAISVDSDVVHDSYKPSQSPYGHGGMPWARAMADGVVGARADFADAFGWDDASSDVAFARRDWVFLPEGDIVTIDRVRTDAAARNTYIRFRTPSTLGLDANVATATVGGSRLAIHAVALSGGTPGVAKVALDDCWASSNYGACKGARFPVDEYAVTLPGPTAYAVHVLDGFAVADTPPVVTSITDSGLNANVLGASVDRAGTRSVVVASNAMSATALSTFTYAAAGDKAARHVVFDAPEDASGKTSVSASVVDGRCVITAKPGGVTAFEGRPLAFHVASAADGCAILENKSATGGLDAGRNADAGNADAGAGDGSDGGSDAGARSSTADGAEGGAITPKIVASDPASASTNQSGQPSSAGCTVARGAASACPWGALGLLALSALFRHGRLRAVRRSTKARSAQ